MGFSEPYGQEPDHIIRVTTTKRDKFMHPVSVKPSNIDTADIELFKPKAALIKRRIILYPDKKEIEVLLIPGDLRKRYPLPSVAKAGYGDPEDLIIALNDAGETGTENQVIKLGDSVSLTSIISDKPTVGIVTGFRIDDVYGSWQPKVHVHTASPEDGHLYATYHPLKNIRSLEKSSAV